MWTYDILPWDFVKSLAECSIISRRNLVKNIEVHFLGFFKNQLSIEEGLNMFLKMLRFVSENYAFLDSGQSICNKARTASKGIRDLASQNVAAEDGHDGSPSLVERTLNFTSLRDPLPGVEQTSFLCDFTRIPETTITTLSNGLRIGSQDSRVRPLAASQC